jgi:hypothetical protein
MATQFSYIPRNTIPSAQERFESRMGIIPDKTVPWSRQKRILPLIFSRVAVTRRAESENMEALQRHAKHAPKAKHFLVVKAKQFKKKPLLAPIGFPNRRFQSVEKVIEFAREIGRDTVRVIRGNRQKDYTVFN